MTDIRGFDQYFMRQPEPAKSCLLALREIILRTDERLEPALKYGMPFYCFKKRMLVYLWTDRITGDPYVGFVDGNLMDHPMLVKGSRARMKIMNIDPYDDLPSETLTCLVRDAILLRERIKK